MSEDWERSRYAHETEMRAAEAAHERWKSGTQVLFESVIGFAKLAVQLAAALNGGAAVAILAFTASIVSSRTLTSGVDYDRLSQVLGSFAFGTLAATIGAGTSYFAQYCYAQSSENQKISYSYPYVQNTPKQMKWRRIGITFQLAAIFFVLFSYALFLFGGYAFNDFYKQAVQKIVAHDAPVYAPALNHGQKGSVHRP